MNRYDLYYEAPPAGPVLPSSVSFKCRKTDSHRQRLRRDIVGK